MNVVCSVQVRLSSTRLPGKALFPLGTNRVLEWVLERAQAGSDGAPLYVTTGNEPENDAIVEWCTRSDVPISRGPEEDLLQRHCAVLGESGYDVLCRLTGDCPFVPPSEIRRIIDAHRTNDAVYTTNVVGDMPTGTAVDVIDGGILRELRGLGEIHPVKRLRAESDQWAVVRSGAPQWTQYSGAHTAVDTPTDYWRLIDAIDAVGTDPQDVTQWVAEQSI